MSALNIARLYRAHVQAPDLRGVERTAFVEAPSHHAAIRKIAAAVGALENRLPAAVEALVYNCHSGEELIAEGLSESPELRIFETGWRDGKPSRFVSEPLFLVDAPAALIRKWSKLPRCEP